MTDATTLDDRIFRPDGYRDGFPHALFADLRRHDPVHWVQESDSPEFPWSSGPGPGYWAVTRHDDVVAVSSNPSVYSANAGTTLIVEPEIPAFLEQQRRQMLNQDPPAHTRLRRLVSRAFTPSAVSRLGARIDDYVATILDTVAPRGHMDLVTDVAAELPLLLLADLLGMPQDDRHQLFDWSNRLLFTADDECGNGLQDLLAAQADMDAYVTALSERRRREPGDDIWSMIVQAEPGGERLDGDELRMFWQLLVIAGNETTRNTISGGVLALLEHSDELALVSRDRSFVPSMVEEVLRWVSPVQHFRRTATADVDLAGTRIRAGDKVVVYYPSANRDEDVFVEPFRFDVRRSPNPHLAFGIGPHFCLGASLARLQLQAVLPAIFDRCERLAPDGPVERVASTFIGGYRHIPLRFEPRGASS